MNIYPKIATTTGDPDYNKLGENIRNVISQYEINNGRQWPVKTEMLSDTVDQYGVFGNLLAQEIALPSDSFDIHNTSIDGVGGRLGGQYSGNRQSYGGSNKVDITFLETNIDIFDYFFKPWIIANSYKGLIEDGTGINELKCNLQLIQFTRDATSYRNSIGGGGGIFSGIGDNNINLSVRKVIEFYDAVPFQINGDSLSYGDQTISDIKRTVSFSFRRYAVVSEEALAVKNDFNRGKVSSGPFPTSSSSK